MPAPTSDRPNPSFFTFSVVPLASGRLAVDCATGRLLGRDRDLTGRCRVVLDLHGDDLVGLPPRQRYQAIAMNLLAVLALNVPEEYLPER